VNRNYLPIMKTLQQLIEARAHNERLEIEELPEDVQWIVSHLQPDKIIWSSHPDILPPSLGYQPKESNVANTFFVSSPQPSIANSGFFLGRTTTTSNLCNL